MVVLANGQLNTLRRYRRQRRFRAESGTNGGTNQKRGRAGATMVLELPVGTIVSRRSAGVETEQLVDLEAEDGQSLVVAWGGRGGQGNMYFRSATNQTPRVAQKGEPGERCGGSGSSCASLPTWASWACQTRASRRCLRHLSGRPATRGRLSHSRPWSRTSAWCRLVGTNSSWPTCRD